MIPIIGYSQISISGVVKDKETGTLIENAIVTLKPTNLSGAGYYSGKKTIKNGAFKLSTNFNYPIQLITTKKGCKTKKIKIKKGDSYVEIIIKCDSESIQKIIKEQTLDTDNDGVLDRDDKCIDLAGEIDNNGCPWPDNDNDGVKNAEDSCVDEAGPLENKGCPYKLLQTVDEMGNILETDTLLLGQELFRFENLSADKSQLFLLEDNDDSEFIRIIMGNDTITASRTKNGYFYKHIPYAPIKIDLIEEEEEILKAAFDNLEFKTGKAIIKQSSFASLENLATLLIKKPDWRILITGHTDSQGKASSNLKLSKKRAKSVATLLVLNDVLKDRIETEWFGETKPIADNKTKVGRQKNRRVEMKVL